MLRTKRYLAPVFTYDCVNISDEDGVMSKSPVVTVFYVVATCVLVTFAHVAHANEQAVSTCRAIAAAAQRLACYDAISVAAPSTAATPAQAKAPKPPDAAKAAPSTATSSADFGLPATVPAAKIDKINSSIPGRFVGWQSNSRITLANGQVWQVIDDSRGFCECDNPKVEITRGSFGTFFLEIEGKGNAPRVKRIQ